MKKMLLLLATSLAISASSMANTLWIAGSFNNWQLPNGSDPRGALAIPESETSGLFEGSVLFPAGSHEFALFYIDPITKKWAKYGTNQATPPFTLLRIDEESPAGTAKSLIYGESDYFNNFTLREWNGTTINFKVDTEAYSNYGSLYMTSYTAEYRPEPQNIYALYSVDGGDWQRMATGLEGPEGEINGTEIRIMYTDKETMDLFDAYGVMDGFPATYSYSEKYLNSVLGGGDIPLQKGGQPVTYKGLNGPIRVSHIHVSWVNQTAYCAVQLPTPDVTGLHYIGSDSDKAVEGIYDVNGIRHDRLHPGVNIIRFTDGTAVKRVER